MADKKNSFPLEVPGQKHSGRKLPKAEPVKDAECKEGAAQECIDMQIGRGTEDGNGLRGN